MKIITLLLTLISFNSFAQYKLNFDLTPDELLLEKLLIPIWQDLKYTQVIADKSFHKVLGDSVTFQLTKATIVLGQKPQPLFKLSLTGQNEARFDWDFSKLTSDIKAKLRFKFKKYGVQITHDEYFIIKANRVGPSVTKLNLNYNQAFKFTHLENNGFEFEQVTVKPQNGVGSVLRYIFDNIFSKEEVDGFITKQVNIELKKWINKQSFIKEVEASVNNQLTKLSQTPIQISDIANHLKVDIRTFDFSTNHLNIGLNPNFVYDNLKVHPCTQLMHRPYQKDSVSASHDLIEQMINNFATYQIREDGKLLEPLLCFGYKEYAENGNPLGEEAEFSFWGRNIKFKYWVVPSTMPKYSYIIDENLIKLNLNLLMKVKSNTYPHLKADNDQLKAKLEAIYKLEFTPGQGLNLVFQNFDVTSITGRVKVKWNRFTPYVKVPLGLIMNELEVMINEQANQDYKITNLVSDELEFLGGIKLLLHDYQMGQSSHKIIFSAR